MVEYLGSGMPRVLKAYPRESYVFSSRFIRATFPISAALNLHPSLDTLSQSSRLESALAAKILLCLGQEQSSKATLAKKLGHKTVSGELHKQVKRLLEHNLISMTLPDTPTSRLQKYQLTAQGHELCDKLDKGNE